MDASRLTAVSPPDQKTGAAVRIVDVRQRVVPLRDDIYNAYIAFANMTVSAVAIVDESAERVEVW